MKQLVLFLILALFTAHLQADEISSISSKYRNWIIGDSSTDYSNPHIQTRYKAILEYVESADQKYNKFTFRPEEKFDFSTKENQSEARTALGAGGRRFESGRPDHFMGQLPTKLANILNSLFKSVKIIKRIARLHPIY